MPSALQIEREKSKGFQDFAVWPCRLLGFSDAESRNGRGAAKTTLTECRINQQTLKTTDTQDEANVSEPITTGRYLDSKSACNNHRIERQLSVLQAFKNIKTSSADTSACLNSRNRGRRQSRWSR